MSEHDEPAKTHKRRRPRRRSLRVPVDEVPRPQSSELALDSSLEGGSTTEMAAYEDDEEEEEEEREGRTTLEDGDEEAMEALAKVRGDAGRTTLDESSSLELEMARRAALEAARQAEEEDEEPELAAEEEEEEEASADAEPSTLAGEEAPQDEEDKRPAPPVGVVVHRVVKVISSERPPPPAAGMADTQPGTELALDLEDDFDEPELRVAEGEDNELDDLDVDLDEGEPPAVQAAAEPVVEQRDSTPELSTEEADSLLLQEEEEEAARKAEAAALEREKPKKRPSKPPPPPPTKGKEAQPAPARAEAAPPPAEAKAEPPKQKKPRRNWWEELFNDDYLRTVPIPRPKIIARQTDFIEQRFGLSPGSTILDVGCGLGLHAVELTRRGYLVVGLDLSLPMLSRAADEAQEYGFKINFLHADMREMNFDGAFDAVLCWGTTFGYFDDEHNKVVVGRLHRALKPRGLLLLDVVNRDFVIRNQPNLVWFEGDGCVVMEESQMNYITSRLEVKRTVILDDGRQRDSMYTLRLYSLHELGQILHHQGFRVVEVTGWEAHPGVFFGGDSPKLIILAERRPSGPPTPPRSPSGEMQAVTELEAGAGAAAPKSEPAPIAEAVEQARVSEPAPAPRSEPARISVPPPARRSEPAPPPEPAEAEHAEELADEELQEHEEIEEHEELEEQAPEHEELEEPEQSDEEEAPIEEEESEEELAEDDLQDDESE